MLQHFPNLEKAASIVGSYCCCMTHGFNWSDKQAQFLQKVLSLFLQQQKDIHDFTHRGSICLYSNPMNISHSGAETEQCARDGPADGRARARGAGGAVGRGAKRAGLESCPRLGPPLAGAFLVYNCVYHQNERSKRAACTTN